jgi:hypothetical protein
LSVCALQGVGTLIVSLQAAVPTATALLAWMLLWLVTVASQCEVACINQAGRQRCPCSGHAGQLVTMNARQPEAVLGCEPICRLHGSQTGHSFFVQGGSGDPTMGPQSLSTCRHRNVSEHASFNPSKRRPLEGCCTFEHHAPLLLQCSSNKDAMAYRACCCCTQSESFCRLERTCGSTHSISSHGAMLHASQRQSLK